MAERHALAAAPRGVLGKKVQHLRREGRLPANVFGRGLASVAIDIDAREFGRIIKSGQGRSLFDLSITGESGSRPVVIRSIARRGGTGDPIHVDFYQVDPTRPIQASVPLRLAGEAPAVRDLAGVLVQQLDHLSIRCTPLATPDHIEADATKLVRFDVPMTVGDIVPPAGVEILTDAAIVVAVVTPPRVRAEA
jgi:large subunit ribosomal protein L25